MSALERLGMAALRAFDPETAHGFAIQALRSGLAPLPRPVVSPRLAVRVAGLDLPNPIGLAAGFDKNAQALGGLSRAGFGFCRSGRGHAPPAARQSAPALVPVARGWRGHKPLPASTMTGRKRFPRALQSGPMAWCWA